MCSLGSCFPKAGTHQMHLHCTCTHVHLIWWVTHTQSIRPSSQPLGQIAKVLKLGKVQEVVFALGLTSSTDPELSAHGKPIDRTA